MNKDTSLSGLIRRDGEIWNRERAEQQEALLRHHRRKPFVDPGTPKPRKTGRRRRK